MSEVDNIMPARAPEDSLDDVPDEVVFDPHEDTEQAMCAILMQCLVELRMTNELLRQLTHADMLLKRRTHDG